MFSCREHLFLHSAFLLRPRARGCEVLWCPSLCVCVCLCVLFAGNFAKFSVRGRVSVFVWRQCDTLCTSGFVDDVMFGGNRPGTGDANRACIEWLTRSQRPGAMSDVRDCLFCVAGKFDGRRRVPLRSIASVVETERATTWQSCKSIPSGVSVDQTAPGDGRQCMLPTLSGVLLSERWFWNR